MINLLFKNKKTVKAEKTQKELNNEIHKLSLEILRKDSFIKCKNDFFILKEKREKETLEWEKIENELKKYNIENLLLKKELSETMNILDIKSLEKQYLIKIDKLISEVRFKKTIKLFKKNGVIHIQSLNKNLIETLIKDEKIKLEVLKRYKNFLNDIMSWDLKTTLIKGEKITKVYSKYRRFINISDDQSVNYMADLSIDFIERLSYFGFQNLEIEEIKLIYIDYKKKYLIKL
ncbi:MAG: hypothetical protein ACRC6Z_06520 [Cetobacterium sp.]